jgi:hypothetical protein
VRRLVLELEDADFKRLEKAAMTRPMPAYVVAVLRAVWDYRDQEAANLRRGAQTAKS